MSERHVVVGSTRRTYWLHQPSEGGPWPTVLVFHGSGENATSFVGDSGLASAAAERDVVIAAIEGPVRDIGGNPVSWDTYTAAEENEDFAFVSAVVRELVGEQIADPTRIYAAGFSQGAFFSYLFGLSRADIIAGVAVQAGCSPYFDEKSQTLVQEARRKIPVYMLVGADDFMTDLARESRQLLERAGHRVRYEEPAVTEHRFIPERSAEMLTFLLSAP